jgi:hypothetical protein
MCSANETFQSDVGHGPQLRISGRFAQNPPGSFLPNDTDVRIIDPAGTNLKPGM